MVSLLSMVPPKNFKPQSFVCSVGSTSACWHGFVLLKGLSHHRNTVHQPIDPAQVPGDRYRVTIEDVDEDDEENDVGTAHRIGAFERHHPVLNGMLYSFISFITNSNQKYRNALQ